jgi:glutamate-1-semialdehyde 2,1-aminomutase
MKSQTSENVRNGILNRYFEKTPTSRVLAAEGKKYLPGGDTRTVAFYEPYPVHMAEGKGCHLRDVDGNEYIDVLNNYTSLILGHAHPRIVEAVRSQLERGTALCAPDESQHKHAAHLCRRIPQMDMVRYCNSGTEATMMAIRAARAYTGRDAVIKMHGGYHGSHDCVEVSVSNEQPVAALEGRGVPASVLNDVMIAPFNDLEAVESILKEHKDRIAAIISEPMQGLGGFIPPKPGHLQGLRDLADQYDVLLIFDEIITFRLSVGGMQRMYDVGPDLTSLGKIIGGGFAIGAFGGRREIMGQFDPTSRDFLFHGGTFNGNIITMVAGLAAMELYDEDAVNRLNELGDRLRIGLDGAFEKAGIAGHSTGLGSLAQVHWSGEEMKNAQDSIGAAKLAGETRKLMHVELLNRGVFAAPRGLYGLSTPMTEKEIDRVIEAFEGALGVLKPYIAENLPHLLLE